MKHTEHRVTATDGTELHVDRWTPEGQTRFVVVVAHGLAEHVLRYRELAERLGARGGLVFGPDHRGQGLSGGPRGHIGRFEDYTADLRVVIERTIEDLPPQAGPDAIPWFLFGHSMGGLVALIYLLDHVRAVPLRGAVLSAPLLRPAVKVGAIKQLAADIFARVAPKIALPTGIPPEDISRDPEVVKRYVADPRRIDVVSAGWAKAMESATERGRQQAKSLTLPMLWYAGTGDRIVDWQATRDVFATLPDPEGNDQTFRAWDGYYHEPHNEPAEQREPVYAMLLDWIGERL